MFKRQTLSDLVGVHSVPKQSFGSAVNYVDSFMERLQGMRFGP